MSGRFITLEGGEGAGKSSCLSAVVDELEAAGIEPLVTREPGGTVVGEALRSLLLDPDQQIAARTELLMVFAARAEHVESVIRPSLDAGRWVLCDRFTDASYAYQGGGRGIDGDSIRWLEAFVQRGLQPHLTLLLDVEPTIGLQRATGEREADRLEQEAIDFYERVRSAYLSRARAEPARFRVIDTAVSLDRVVETVRDTLRTFLAREHG